MPSCCIAPFVASSLVTFEYTNPHNDLCKKLTILENPILAYDCELLEEEVNDNDDFTYNNWTFNATRHEKYKNLYVDVWRKENKKVFVINESEYEAVGEMDISFFSDSKDDLNEFLNDNQLSFGILENEIVQYHL